MEARDAIAALTALAHETRLAVFRLLVQRGQAGLPAGEVATRLGIPAATLSFHLAHLRHAGLCLSRRDGRQILYAADYGRMKALLAYLTENCCRLEEPAPVPVRLAGPAPRNVGPRGSGGGSPPLKSGAGFTPAPRNKRRSRRGN